MRCPLTRRPWRPRRGCIPLPEGGAPSRRGARTCQNACRVRIPHPQPDPGIPARPMPAEAAGGATRTPHRARRPRPRSGERRQRVEVAHVDQVQVRVGGQVGRVEDRAAVGGELRVAVGVLVVEGAAVVGQDARPDIALPVPAEELDEGLRGVAEDRRRGPVADDQSLIQAVEVGRVEREARLDRVAVVPPDVTEDMVAPPGAWPPMVADPLAVGEPVLVTDRDILAVLRPDLPGRPRLDVQPPDALRDLAPWLCWLVGSSATLVWHSCLGRVLRCGRVGGRA